MAKDGGKYANDGLSWDKAKDNVQDAINDLYDYMQRNNLHSGSVYVAGGKYEPSESTGASPHRSRSTTASISTVASTLRHRRLPPTSVCSLLIPPGAAPDNRQRQRYHAHSVRQPPTPSWTTTSSTPPSSPATTTAAWRRPLSGTTRRSNSTPASPATLIMWYGLPRRASSATPTRPAMPTASSMAPVSTVLSSRRATPRERPSPGVTIPPWAAAPTW